jgi:hypothetical protein
MLNDANERLAYYRRIIEAAQIQPIAPPICAPCGSDAHKVCR